MARRRERFPVLAGALILVVLVVWLAGGWLASGPLERQLEFDVGEGEGLSALADDLEAGGAVDSATLFKLRARLLGGGTEIKAGSFLLPKGASEATILEILKGDKVIRRLITIPEGMPSVMVAERLMANKDLVGPVSAPADGTVLPDSYDWQKGEPRAAVLKRMQAAMDKTLAELWAKRTARTVAKTPQEALVLASIVEKETGKPEERRMVAGLYSNRLRQRMLLQADPTIIYPITRGKPLGRRIRQSEIQAVNGYNTYTMIGLPIGPITNPGRDSIAAVLDPAETDALFMVADGSGGHVFAATLAEHNANVAKWFALRKARGEM
ncbi:endolytic transglycosylase MltG [Novosphingobium sp. MMS21-SN21R]|uniref:endolytic transglycosylase MltG n=1 Tax=Novosphingobium sp. MMS21-SN21R TaxID=2969298 RepID=UPI00288710C0|nr:endolytic transglycosylase MltG [Novosphingobium sp. MMS21-SN21R]MDT0507436.1 endolytic transglycosylase MltG [Novosphingobium sp. MMS21-SN21R]